MRSEARASSGQDLLPFDLLTPVDGPAPDRARRGGRPAGRRGRAEAADAASDGADAGFLRCRLRNDAFASHGWPAGTELLVDTRRRPKRGEVALVREGGRLKIGVFDLQLGRAVLRTDRGATWLGQTARYVGVATLVGAPLAGMPEPPAP